MITEQLNKYPIRLLHLSDVHFELGKSWDSVPILRALSTFIKKEVESGLAPDLVAFTGDLAFSGKSEEYTIALDWLQNQLWAAFPSLSRDRLLIVPGNHDVDRSKVSFGAESIQKNLLKDKDQHKFTKVLKDNDDRSLLLKRSASYLNFLQDWYGLPQTLPWWQRNFEIRGTLLNIAGLDSALLAHGDEDRNRLLIGRYQLNDTIKTCRASEADWKLTLVHHPWDYLVEWDASEIRQAIHQHCDLLLRGHLHFPQTERILPPDNTRTCLELAAGCVYEDSKYQNAFQWIELYQHPRRVRVHYRAWLQGEWNVDRNQPSCPDGFAEYRFEHLTRPVEQSPQKTYILNNSATKSPIDKYRPKSRAVTSLVCQDKDEEIGQCTTCDIYQNKKQFLKQRHKNNIHKMLLAGIANLYHKLSYLKAGNILIPFEVIRSRLIYPISNEIIRSRISGQSNESNAVTFLLDVDDFREQHNAFLRCLNDSYNPGRDYLPAKYFIKTETIKSLDKIPKYLLRNDEQRSFYLVGEKGSGKTITQNCWLHDSKAYFDQEKIFWVRCDAHKLYRFWEKHYSHENLATLKGFVEVQEGLNLEKYLKVQFLYVIAKYFFDSNRITISAIHSIIKHSGATAPIPFGRSDKTEPRNLYNELCELNKIIEKEEHKKSHDYSYAFDKLMVSSKSSIYQKEQRKWINISDEVKKIMINSGFKILQILDSVDQVHINSPHAKALYDLMLEQVYQFSWYKPPEYEARLLVIRERTLIDINRTCHQILRQDHYDCCIPEEILHEPPHVEKVLEKRFKIITEENEQTIAHDGIYGRIIESINNCIKEGENNCNHLHHNNCRAFLNNAVTLVAQIYYRYYQLNKQQDMPENFNVNQQVRTFKKRNRFLNGRLFLNTHAEWNKINTELGSICFNLFYYDLETVNNPSIWYGLVNTRILQYLLAEPHVGANDLTKQLVHLFGYDELLINKNILNLRAFGLIDSKEIRNPQSRLTDVAYIISEKGKLLLDETYSDVNTLYYFSLDTPLPERLVEEGYICSHSNKNTKTGYPYSSVVSAFSFLSFIVSISENEVSKLQANGYSDLDRWRLPSFRQGMLCKLIKSFESNFNRAETEEKEKVVKFLSTKFRVNASAIKVET